MGSLIHLDTHIVSWLFAADKKRLRPYARSVEKHGLVYSPMVELELQYLFESQRTTEPAQVVLSALAASIGLMRSTAQFGRIVEVARGYVWTRDPFDRLIAANAAVDGLPLLTGDDSILENCSFARRK